MVTDRRNHQAIYVDRVCCEYRVRDNGLSGGLEARSPRWLEAHTVVREKHLRSHWVPALHHHVLTGVLSNNYWALGMNYFREARFKEARSFFLKGLGYRPLHLKSCFLWCITFLPSWVIDSMRSAKHDMKIW